MKKLTHKQFAETLASRPGTIILSIVANTDPKLKKTGNPFPEVRKETYTRVVTGVRYEQAVERQGGEGFVAGELPYGEMAVRDKVIAGPKGDYQLRTVARNPQKPISVRFLSGGKEIDKKEIAIFLPVRKESKKQAEAGVKGKKQVMVRNFSFDNIEKVTMMGETFELVK